jgi:hypothetical protein
LPTLAVVLAVLAVETRGCASTSTPGLAIHDVEEADLEARRAVFQFNLPGTERKLRNPF